MKNFTNFNSLIFASVILLLAACGASNNGSSSSPTPTAAPDTAVDQPYITHRGAHPWVHRDHKDIDRPTYNWHSEKVRGVSCEARDSHGTSYVVIERDYHGLEFQVRIREIEDSSVDRCVANSHDEAGCKFHDCTPEF